MSDLGRPRQPPGPPPPGRPPFAPPPGTPYYGPPPDAGWSPPPGTVFGGGPDVLASTGKGRRPREAWPSVAPPVPASDPVPAKDSGSRTVAVLLAVAAIVAALVTARASIVSSDAASAWIASVAAEQQRGAYLLEGVRYTYGTEGDLAFMIASAQAQVQELTAVASGQPPDLAGRVTAEASVHQGVLDGVLPASEVAGEPRYALPDGGYDLELRLADQRTAAEGDITAIDPPADVAAGDAAADHATNLMLATIGIGAAFLLGSLAQAFGRRRRVLLTLGWVTLGVAAAVALAIELDAAGIIATGILR